MSDSVIVPINYIERKPGSSKFRVVDKGVTVEFLSRLIDDPKWPMARICENYNLTPSEVFAAWSFYYDHKEEIDRTVEEESRRFDEQIANDERRAKLIEQYEKKTGQPYPGQQ